MERIKGYDVGAMSYNNTARSVRPMSENFGASPAMYKAGKTMKALMLAGMMGMAAVAMSSCKQPTDPTALTYEEPTDVEETDPTNPTNPVNPDTPTEITVQDTGIYKALSALGFDISTEKVPAVDGQYQPKTGDITSLSYRQVDNATKYTYTYTLDRENSTEDNVVYKGKVLNERNNRVYDSENSTIAVNREEKSVDIYDTRSDTHRKFTLNDDDTLTAVLESGDAQQMTIGENKSIYGVRGETFADIKIKLAE